MAVCTRVWGLTHVRMRPQCSVLYFIDISQQCGFTLAQQMSLFENIKPLFVGKPLLVVATKIDAMPLEELAPDARAAVRARACGRGVRERGASQRRSHRAGSWTAWWPRRARSWLG